MSRLRKADHMHDMSRNKLRLPAGAAQMPVHVSTQIPPFFECSIVLLQRNAQPQQFIAAALESHSRNSLRSGSHRKPQSAPVCVLVQTLVDGLQGYDGMRVGAKSSLYLADPWDDLVPSRRTIS
jgi:hypothetical protein